MRSALARSGHLFKEASVKSNKTLLLEDLKRQILTMELSTEEELDEVLLSERYGLSRTPIREIFRRISGDGYLDIRKNRGDGVSTMQYSKLRNIILVVPLLYADTGRP